MQLQDIENELLNRTQQTEMVNFGGEPDWADSVNPLLSKALLDHYINRAYIRALRDTAELEIAGVTQAFPSTVNTSTYALPPPSGGGTPNAPVHLVQRVYYKPVGMTYTIEFEAGIRLLAWKEFQRKRQAGYYASLAFGAQPAWCSMTPDRKSLVFFPGSASAGDTITVAYSPVPTAGTLTPLLAAHDDVPIVPDEYDELLILAALPAVWQRLREFGAAKMAQMEYDDGNGHGLLPETIKTALKRTRGDKLRITFAEDDLATAGPFPWLIGGGN